MEILQNDVENLQALLPESTFPLLIPFGPFCTLPFSLSPELAWIFPGLGEKGKYLLELLKLFFGMWVKLELCFPAP